MIWPHSMRRAAGFLGIAAAAVCAVAREPEPTPEGYGRVAFLPAENLTGRTLDAAPIEDAMRAALGSRGVELIGVAEVQAVMDRHRVRFTGGLDAEVAAAFRDEARVDAVVITSIERWLDADPPELGLTLRVVSTAPSLDVLASGDVGVNGEDRPGFLRLGVVHDAADLLARAASRLADAVTAPAGRAARRGDDPERRFRPKMAFHGLGGSSEKSSLRVAVLPFTNRSTRRSAGDLVALHFVRRLAERSDLHVVEPGLVRSVLLKLHLIPAGGISYAQADLLRETLGADLVVTGEVLDYVDGAGEGAPPVVDYTAQLLDTAGRRAVWSSFSHNGGTDRVWFFDRGHLRSASALGSQMALATVDRMFRRKGQP